LWAKKQNSKEREPKKIKMRKFLQSHAAMAAAAFAMINVLLHKGAALMGGQRGVPSDS